MHLSHMYQAVLVRCCFYFTFQLAKTLKKMSLQMLFIYKKIPRTWRIKNKALTLVAFHENLK